MNQTASAVAPYDTRSVVIIGGGLSGREVAKALQKNKDAPSITIVQPHEYCWANPTAPYFLSHPHEIDQKWNTKKGSVAEISKVSIPGVKYAFGEVMAINVDSKTITIDTGGDDEAGKLRYDELVVAVGVKYPVITPEANLRTFDQLKRFYKETFPTAVQGARSILIGGAGAVACEMAKTLRSLNPNCKISMVSSGATALPAWQGSSSKIVNDYLQQINVDLIPHERLQETEHSLTPGTYTLTKSGRAISADIYLPFFGSVPTLFMPEGSCEAASGRVKVNNRGQSTTHPSVYAVGCGSEVRMSSYANIQKEATTVANNIVDKTATLPQSMEKSLLYMHFEWGQYSVVNAPFPASVCCRCMGCPLCFFCPCCLACGWNGCHPAGKLPSSFMKAAFFDSMGMPHLAPFKNMDKEAKSIKRATMQR